MTLHDLADLALSHHHQEQWERCIVVGGRHHCRRCTVLYPIALVVMSLFLASRILPFSVAVALMLTLPIPVTVEFLGEQFGHMRYNARRQVVVTALAAPALGIGLARVVVDRTDPWFWLMVAVFAFPCAVVSVLNAHRSQRIEQAWSAANEASLAFREFNSSEEFRAYIAAVEAKQSGRL